MEVTTETLAIPLEYPQTKQPEVSTVTVTSSPQDTDVESTTSSPVVFSGDPDFARVPFIEIDDVPGSLPLAEIPPDVEHVAVVESCLKHLDPFNPDIFTENSIWRDVFALTGTGRTFFSSPIIRKAWEELAPTHAPHNFAIIPYTSGIKRIPGDYSWIQARFTFETEGSPGMNCSGVIGVVPDENKGWKIWLLSTIIESIKGFPHPDYLTENSTRSTQKGQVDGEASDEYECVVVGAGYGGLCVAGRLNALGVNYLGIEKNDRIGDNWRQRYDSARFHTSKWFSEMPVERVFSEDYDYFPSGPDLARGYAAYVEQMKINVWLSTALQRASYDANTHKWLLHVNRKGKDIKIRTKHWVMAIGVGSGQVPSMPDYPGRERFKGPVLHSAQYKNACEWAGKKGVIVGAGNTAHDVAEDMVHAGLSTVTMVQRGATPVFPIEYYKKWADPLWHATSSIEDADRETMAIPLVVTRLTSMYAFEYLASTEPERFASLERAGFKLDRRLDLWRCLTKRNGGHYMDVGASAKIAAGLIKMQSDATVSNYTETGLEFSDGSKLDADAIVFCTGFTNEVRNEAIKFVGPEIGEKLDDYWRLDTEGELRGAYKKQGWPGIWYTGGGVTHARFYSRFIALQIKADLAGTPLPVYKRKANMMNGS